jgi:hypothetical protein
MLPRYPTKVSKQTKADVADNNFTVFQVSNILYLAYHQGVLLGLSDIRAISSQ